MDYIISEIQNNTGIITLNNPEALNAIGSEMLAEIANTIKAYDNNDEVSVIMIRGNEKAFAAGIDLNELSQNLYQDESVLEGFRESFNTIEKCHKPLIASVAGYALGIGCELAMYCDIIFAADNARFGLPEISLGCISGFGGTQLLTRAVGKAKAMEMILTGRAMNAEEAEKCGLISRIIPLNDLDAESVKTAEKISSMPRTAVIMAKDAVRKAKNSNLHDGIDYERRNCQICLNSADFRESLAAFAEKRQPNFRNN